MRRVGYMRFRAASMAALLPPGDPAAHSPARHGKRTPASRPPAPAPIPRERDHPSDDQGFY
jgi:hypothetical protein